MKIAIVIASYGYGHLVGQAIDSVLSQIVPFDQILVVDDGAHDGVGKVAASMGVPYIEREKNMGIVDNFQDILTNHVDADRVMFLGGDNWLHPECLFELKKYIDYDVVTYDLYVTGPEAKKYRNLQKCDYDKGYWIRPFQNHQDFRRMIGRSNVAHGSSVYNVKMARDVGGYMHHPGKKRPEEDWYLFKRMSEAGAKMFSVRRPLMYYRRHKDNFLGVY